MNVSSFICSILKFYRIKKAFVYPGGTVAPLLDEMEKSGIEIHCFRNEQGAGYAAIGAAKVSGDPQVVIVTSGPGATNIVTPVADAYYDSVPILVFTGQVATNYINFDKKVRQTGFQETDVVSIFKNITKKSFILMPNDNFKEKITEALNLTVLKRPGPVVIDLPMDTQRTNIEEHPTLEKYEKRTEKHEKIDQNKIKKTIELLKEAKRPVVLAGNGVLISNATHELRNFIEGVHIPIITSLPAVGVVPRSHPLYFGFLGHTGEFYANLAMYYADLVLVLGSRLDIRQVGNRLDAFKEKKIIRVDIDPNEIKYSKIRSFIYFTTDVKAFLKEILKQKPPELKNDTWISTLAKWKNEYCSSRFYRGNKLFMKDIIEYVSHKCERKRVVVSSGVGGHQQLTARYFEFDYPQKMWITSAGHGTMGFDLPSVLGALIEKRGDFDFGLVFVGDGSFQMNIQELATLRELKLPIKIFVLDDKRLGIVSQFQLLNWGRDPATGNKNNPSFSKIAKAYDIKGVDLTSKKDLKKLDLVLSDMEPWVVHCHIESKEDVLPMLLANQELNEMYPFGKVVHSWEE